MQRPAGSNSRDQRSSSEGIKDMFGAQLGFPGSVSGGSMPSLLKGMRGFRALCDP